MKQYLLYLILFLFSSCSLLNKKSSLYGRCGKHYFHCSQLELKENKEFEYLFFMDVGGEKILKGKWEALGGDTLILNTYKQPHIPKTYFTATVNPQLSDDTVIVKLQNYNGPLPGTVNINDNLQSQFTDDKGIAVFKTKEVFNISFLGDYPSIFEQIALGEPKSNYIEIFARDADTPEIITDVLIVARRRAVIFLPAKAGDDLYKLKRTRLSKKQWR